MSKNTPTIIVAAEALLRGGIATLLQNTPYTVVANVARPEESQVRLPERGAILAIVGIILPYGKLDEAAESVGLLRSLLPDGGKVVLIVETDATIDVPRLLTLSSDGCIVNLGSRDSLLKTLELVFMNERIFAIPRSIATTATESTSNNNGPTNIVNEPGSNRSLSPRERQVLNGLAEGKSNKVIARQYGLAETTVKVHLKAVLRKIGAHNRTQAAIWAIERGSR